MPPDDKRNHLEDLKKKLYMRDERMLPKHREGVLHQVPHEVNAQWVGTTDASLPAKSHSKFFKKVFLIAILFFIGSIVFAGFMFFHGANTVSNDKVVISVLGNAFTPGGTELSLQIEVTNTNSVPLQSADLLIEYPKGSDATDTANYIRTRQSLGDIDTKKTIIKDVAVVLFGEQGSTKDIKLTVEYRVPNSNAVFVKEKSFTVNISSAPLTLTMTGTDQTASNQEVHLQITATLNTKTIAPHTVLKLEYPPGFQFESADAKALYGNTIWSLDGLLQGTPKIINIKGFIFGQNGDDLSFHAYTGEENLSNTSELNVVYASILHTLALRSPFLSATLALNGTQAGDFAANAGDTIRGEVQWANTLDTSVGGGVITVQLSGDAFTASEVSTDGFYDSSTNTITWDRNSATELAVINPKANGTVSFTLDIPENISGKNINLSVSIKGNQQNDNGMPQEINSVSSRTIKLNSNIALSSSLAHANGPFVNTGAIPPQAEKQTTYTVTWNATNSLNLTSNAQVRAVLPLYVQYLNQTNPKGESVTYNDSTREVIWNMGSLASGAGVTAANRNVSFQIGFKPSLSQVGTAPQLVGPSTLTATDTFTNAILKSSIRAITTQLSGSEASAGSDTVVK